MSQGETRQRVPTPRSPRACDGLGVPPLPWERPGLPLAFDVRQLQTGLAGRAADPRPCPPPHALPAGLGTACPPPGAANCPAAQVRRGWSAASRAGERGRAEQGTWGHGPPRLHHTLPGLGQAGEVLLALLGAPGWAQGGRCGVPGAALLAGDTAPTSAPPEPCPRPRCRCQSSQNKMSNHANEAAGAAD